MSKFASQDTMLRAFSDECINGESTIFVGAGISKPSGLPDWSSLLKPHLADLNLEIEDFNGDFPLIAQHIVNENAGNRSSLLTEIRRIINSSAKPNSYHVALSRINCRSFWTTNFDTLLEQALGSSLVVRTSDEDMSLVVTPQQRELVKVHGCVKSNPDRIVITRQDFEDYFEKRPAMSDRLAAELQRRSVLFLGYSYQDSSIQRVVLKARSRLKGTTRRHFLVDSVKKDKSAQAQQEIFALDCKRVGIECVLLKDWGELEPLLNRLALCSRGKSLYVTGSHEKQVPDRDATAVGELLASHPDLQDLILLDGQSSGVSRSVINAYSTALVQKKADLRQRVKLYLNPYSVNPSFSNDPSLLPILRDFRREPLMAARTVLVFDGGMGTDAEISLANELGCRLVPYPRVSGGNASKLLIELQKTYDEPAFWNYVEKAKEMGQSPQDVVDLVAAFSQQ